MHSLWRDVCCEARSLRKAPGFTTVVLLTLVLAVGANTAVFSVVRTVLLRPLPFPEPDRLVWITEVAKLMGLDAAFGSDYIRWKSDNGVFSELAAFTPSEINFRSGDLPRRVPGASVSREFFSVLGVQPVFGRSFTAEEDHPGGPAALIISQAVWREDFGGNEDVLGSTAMVNGHPAEIVGVMPADFDFPQGAKLWRPLALNVEAESSRDNVSLLRVVGRLRPEVTYERARSDLGVIHGRVSRQFPEMYANIRIQLTPLSRQLASDARNPLLLSLGAVVLLLLIACANLAALLLARSSARRREMGLRAALGAGRMRLMRQSFVQSSLLSLVGGTAGLASSGVLCDVLLSFAPVDFPRIGARQIDGVVVAFALGICVLVSVLCGLAPALTASSANPNELLRNEGEGSRSPLRLRSGLVVAEVGLALVLLIGAGLFIRSLWRLAQVDPGMNPRNVLTMSVRLSSSDYPEEFSKHTYLNRFLQELGSLPGAKRVGACTSRPLDGSPLTGPVEVEGRPELSSGELRIVGWFAITPGYFQTMGMQLLSGRDFVAEDRADGAAVAVVNQRFARLFLREGNPVGQRIRAKDSEGWTSVVGVVRDALNAGFDREAEPEVYRPMAQLRDFGSFSAFVRTNSRPEGLAELARLAAFRANPNQPVFNLVSMEEIAKAQSNPRRFIALLLSVFSALAFGLALLGVYGLTAYSVACRTREIGIRLSLGARQWEVMGLFVGRGLVLVLLGVTLGFVASLLLGRLISSQLYGLSGTDPATLITTSIAFLGVGLVASCLAARRVSKLDPCTILRSE